MSFDGLGVFITKGNGVKLVIHVEYLRDTNSLLTLSFKAIVKVIQVFRCRKGKRPEWSVVRKGLGLDGFPEQSFGSFGGHKSRGIAEGWKSCILNLKGSDPIGRLTLSSAAM